MSISPEKYLEIMDGIGDQIIHTYNCGYQDGLDFSKEKLTKDIAETIGQTVAAAFNDSQEGSVPLESHEKQVNDLKDMIEKLRRENYDMRLCMEAKNVHIKKLYEIIEKMRHENDETHEIQTTED